MPISPENPELQSPPPALESKVTPPSFPQVIVPPDLDLTQLRPGSVFRIAGSDGAEVVLQPGMTVSDAEMVRLFGPAVAEKTAQNRTRAVLADIEQERTRQKSIGWTVEHDDTQQPGGELASGAAGYALASIGADALVQLVWPWDNHGPQINLIREGHDRRGLLVRAAALTVAEIERLDRQAAVDRLAFAEPQQ
jgi:hypothetical protein